MNNYYVYVIYQPNGTPCYVGKGKGNRVEANIRSSHNKQVAALVRMSGGRVPYSKIVEEVSEPEAFELETALIYLIGRHPHGPLFNLTAGGDGVSGYVQTPEHLAKLSAVRRGRKLPDEAKRKLSALWKGRVFSDAHRAAISAAKRGKPGRPLSDAHREALRLTNLGKKRAGAALEAIRAAAARMSPEAKARKSARISASLMGKRLSESHRASISRVQKGRQRSAAFRAKVSAGMRAYRAAQRAAKSSLSFPPKEVVDPHAA